MSSEIDDINDSLDHLSDLTFNDVPSAWRAIALELESYGIAVPDVQDFDGEMRFKLFLDDEIQPHYLYVNFDNDDDNVDEETAKTIVYATFVDPEESDLLDHLTDQENGTDVEAHHQRIRKMSDY